MIKSRNFVVVTCITLVILFTFVTSLSSIYNSLNVPYSVQATGISSTLVSSRDDVYTYDVVYEYKHNNNVYTFLEREYHAGEYDYVGYTWFINIDEDTGERITDLSINPFDMIRSTILKIMPVSVFLLLFYITYANIRKNNLRIANNSDDSEENAVKIKIQQTIDSRNDTISNTINESNYKNEDDIVSETTTASKYDCENDPFADFYKKTKK